MMGRVSSMNFWKRFCKRIEMGGVMAREPWLGKQHGMWEYVKAMKTKQLFTLAMAGLLTAALTVPAYAEQAKSFVEQAALP